MEDREVSDMSNRRDGCSAQYSKRRIEISLTNLCFSRAVLTRAHLVLLPDQPVVGAKRGGLFLDNRNFLAGRS